MARAPRLVRALSAALALLVLVVGAPIALWRLGGWPLPHRVPIWSDVWRAVQQGDLSGTVIVRGVACVLWLVWLQVLWAIVWELVVNVPGRQRATRPRPAPAVAGPIGHGVARLVSAVLMVGVVTAQTPAAALVASAAGSWRAPAAGPSAATAAGRVTVAAIAAEVPAARADAARWRVARGDSLWEIAERSLGDGARFGEILELNPGLTGPRDVHPGQELLLPPDAHVPTERRVTAATVDVASGDTLWGLARAHLATDTSSPAAPTEQEIADHVTHIVEVNDIESGDPDLIHPGERYRLPAVGREEEAPAEVLTQPAVAPPVVAPDDSGRDDGAPARAPTGGPGDARAAAVTADATRPRPAAPAPAPAPEHSGEVLVRLIDAAEPVRSAASMLPAGLAGGTLLATGAVGLLASRRRRRLRSLGPLHPPVAADVELAPAEAALRLAADPQGMARLDVALRHLAASAATSAARPQLVVRRASGDLEVWFTTVPARPPTPPWVPGRDARCVVLPVGTPLPLLAAAARGVPSPCPALVLLGRCDDDEVYVDLEAAGAIVIDGSPAVVAAVARAVVASLAVSPLADVVDVVACGVDCYGFTRQRRVHRAADAAEAIATGNQLVDVTRRELLDSGLASTFALRAHRREEPWEPAVVVVVRSGLGRAQLTALDDLAAGGGAAVITDRPLAGASWHLRATGPGCWRLDPLGLELQAPGLAANELADLGALLTDADGDTDAATDAATVAGADPRADVELEPDPPPMPATSPHVDRPWGLLARVLGPVEIITADDATVEFERAKALELVVWLAHHRTNPNRANARTALWQTDVRDATFLNVVSDARRALARGVPPPDGDEWIGRSGGDRLPLHPLVVTDAELLAARLAGARARTGADAIDTLRSGLELVRGAPLDGVAYLWPDGEGLPSALTHLVTSSATELAERYLEVGDLDGVLWATGRGLCALPGHEELVCLRMRAHHRAGNHAGVRAEFESYERVIVNDDWGDGEPAPHVIALRNELLGRRIR